MACLILKVMLEDIPRHGSELADELREAGAEIKRHAQKELSDLYPDDPDGATPIAYLWARTVRCEAPDCGAEIPLMRSFWLCRKPKRKWALRPSVERTEGFPPRVRFEIFEPKSDREVPGGTVTRAKANCRCCAAVLPPDRVRTQLAAERGGADTIFDVEGNRVGDARMMAVVTRRSGKSGRHYRLPTDADYAAVRRAQARVAGVLEEWARGTKQGPSPIPDEPISLNEIRRISVPIYGMTRWGDLFTARQKAALVELARSVSEVRDSTKREILAIVLDRCANQLSHVSRWNVPGEKVEGAFARQALPVVWDYAEVNPFGNATGSYQGALDWVVEFVQSAPRSRDGQLQLADAVEHPLPDQSASIWFTDPPYYDAVPYAHLSDFFYVWLKRALPNSPLLNCSGDDLPASATTPKDREIVVDRPHRLSSSKKDAHFYESALARAFAEGRRVLEDGGIGSVVFAHKTTEGWEALLSGMISGGWTITGSWPVATEMTSRLNARETASLATSVHLICRPRPDDAPVGDWTDVLRELPGRVGDWMERLQAEGVRGADLVFACIGPALEIFSRYLAVETAEGAEVGLPDYLEKVWEVVGRAALEQVLGTAEAAARNGMAGALEEDARLTALFLWALESTQETERPARRGSGIEIRDASSASDPGGEAEEAVARATAKGFHLPFDVVRRFSQPMGIDLDRWTGRVIAQEKGVVRLLPVVERAKALFGTDGAVNPANWIEADGDAGGQMMLLPEMEAEVRTGRAPAAGTLDADPVLSSPDATGLDRVHAAMLMQSGGHSNALRGLIAAEQDRGPDFLRLSNALSALYPRGSREKRLLDAMLLAVPK